MYSIWFILLVLWSTSSSLPVSDDGLSPEFLQNENKTLSLLKEESENTGYPFNGAWQKSELETFYKEFKEHEGFESKDLNREYRLTEILNLGEIRILICYCYKVPPFFQQLNKDLRENCGKPQRYPVATEVLKSTITKLMNYQSGTNQSLPEILYRNEPDFVFAMYQNLFNRSKQGVLKQFTSTSRSYEKAKQFNPGADRMVIEFEDPQVGADVDDFSIFDEFEVLLPVSAVYTVQNASKDDNNNYDVVISGPKVPTSGQKKLTSDIFVVLVITLKFI